MFRWIIKCDFRFSFLTFFASLIGASGEILVVEFNRGMMDVFTDCSLDKID